MTYNLVRDALLSADDLKTEIGSPFHGAMLSRKSAVMHMGRYATGLAQAVIRHGGQSYLFGDKVRAAPRPKLEPRNHYHHFLDTIASPAAGSGRRHLDRRRW